MASYCTSALELWIWLSVADRNLHYKYYQSFSPLHHSNIRYFSIVQKSWVAKLCREGICIFLLLDLVFFHYKLVLPLYCYMIEASYIVPKYRKHRGEFSIAETGLSPLFNLMLGVWHYHTTVKVHLTVVRSLLIWPSSISCVYYKFTHALLQVHQR